MLIEPSIGGLQTTFPFETLKTHIVTRLESKGLYQQTLSPEDLSVLYKNLKLKYLAEKEFEHMSQYFQNAGHAAQRLIGGLEKYKKAKYKERLRMLYETQELTLRKALHVREKTSLAAYSLGGFRMYTATRLQRALGDGYVKSGRQSFKREVLTLDSLQRAAEILMHSSQLAQSYTDVGLIGAGRKLRKHSHGNLPHLDMACIVLYGRMIGLKCDQIVDFFIRCGTHATLEIVHKMESKYRGFDVMISSFRSYRQQGQDLAVADVWLIV